MEPPRLDQGSDAETGAGTQDQLRTAGAEAQRPNSPGPKLGDGRQRKRLCLEVVEQQALPETEAAGDIGAVHNPRRVGQFKRAADDRTRAAGDHRARARLDFEYSRFDRLNQSRIVPGLEMYDVAERRVRLRLQSQPNVRAADIADQHRKRKSEVAHVAINEEPADAVKRSRKIAPQGDGTVFGPFCCRRELIGYKEQRMNVGWTSTLLCVEEPNWADGSNPQKFCSSLFQPVAKRSKKSSLGLLSL